MTKVLIRFNSLMARPNSAVSLLIDTPPNFCVGLFFILRLTNELFVGIPLYINQLNYIKGFDTFISLRIWVCVTENPFLILGTG